MHTSALTYGLFISGIIFASLAQLMNYYLAVFPAQSRVVLWRSVVLVLGLMGIGLAGCAAYRASIDWAALPTSPENLSPGQLWDDGGIPAIVKKQ